MSITKVSDNMRDTTTLDATKLSGNLPAISGSSLTGVGGKVLQVVSAFGGSGASSTVNSVWHTAGTAINITPASTSNYILLFANGSGFFNGGTGYPVLYMGVRRTLGGTTTNTAGNTEQAVYLDARSSGTLFGQHQFPITVIGKDAPSTTSQLTYQLEYKGQGASWAGTIGVFQQVNIMAMEIDAT